MDTIDWLLNSDPAISWQAMRDLTDASPAAIAAERARVPREGIGAEILARQGSDGSWHRTDAPVWLPTLYTLLLLRATGADRAEPAVESAVARLEAGFRWDEEFRERPFKPFFEGEVEPCINGGTLALALLRAPDREPRAPSRRRAARGNASPTCAGGDLHGRELAGHNVDAADVGAPERIELKPTGDKIAGDGRPADSHAFRSFGAWHRQASLMRARARGRLPRAGSQEWQETRCSAAQ